MSAVGVDLGQLDELVSRMAVLEQQLDTADAEIDRCLDRLQADWRGSAAAAHQETRHRWSAGAAEMRTALAELRAIAAVAHANYESAVRANVGMWCG